MKQKRIMVTGGAGFIGSHLTDRLLAQGHQVIVFDNLSSGSMDNVPAAAIFLQGDVCNPQELESAFANGLDAVFHIAGQASTIRAFDTPHIDLEINTIGTLNVVQKCIQHGVTRLLYASSMTAYGHPDQLPVPESTPCNPISYYGITKYAAERYVHSSAQRNDLTTPLNVTSFRMFNVYGERQKLDNPYQGVMGIFIGNALREEPIKIFGDGHQSRDFIHIADVVSVWTAALENPATFGRVFNLGIGYACSMNELVRRILAGFGHDPGQYPINYYEERPGDQRHMTADISAVCETLDWQPEISLDAGIQRTIDWARAHG